mgnify:CR=1 FL=1
MTCKHCEYLKDVNNYTIQPETLGRIVRDVWMRWAEKQPDCKQDWCDPWELLPERIKEVDILIGKEIELAVRLGIAAYLGSPVFDESKRTNDNERLG